MESGIEVIAAEVMSLIREAGADTSTARRLALLLFLPNRQQGSNEYTEPAKGLLCNVIKALILTQPGQWGMHDLYKTLKSADRVLELFKRTGDEQLLMLADFFLRRTSLLENTRSELMLRLTPDEKITSPADPPLVHQ